MSIDRHHAFADGAAYLRSTRWLPPWKRHGPEWRSRLAWAQFERGAQVAAGCRLGPNSWLVNRPGVRDRVRLQEGVICRGLLRIEEFGSGQIIIEPQAYIGDDCLFSSSATIEIGSHALIAHGVQIFDNDSHPLDPADRSQDYSSVRSGGVRREIASAPVRVGSHAWVGFNAIILKGVVIGENSVVAAGSVVTKSVPANSVVAGNPAVVVKSIDHVST
jgi:acetyltransferase-like isoleucine patch superfamily enzyme